MIYNTYEDEHAVENAEFGDWVYFTERYYTADILVPEDTRAMVRNDLLPDEMPVTDGFHMVQIELDGRYYEIEVPYDMLAMQ